LNPHLREKNVALIFESDLSFPRAIHTDALRLRQILMNLLGNSLKFTGRGRVSLKARREERFLVFDVEDTGIGIPPQSREVIFKPFEQGEKGHAHKFGGTGLGIPLSQHLAQLLGGDLQLVWSEPGKGSHFRVRVEYEEASVDFSDPVPEAISAPLEERPLSDLRGMKVLAVDDSEDGRHLIAAMLTEKGCEVELAENGREALEKALSRPFDVVLMDLQMPVMDGVSAVKTLRSKGSQVPVVALTARAMTEDSEECMRAGFSDFLSKPIEYERLVGAVGHYRSRHSLRI
jgi:CheY-like chemotaxis protein